MTKGVIGILMVFLMFYSSGCKKKNIPEVENHISTDIQIDTVYFNSILEQAYSLVNSYPDSAIYYINKALLFSKEANYTKGIAFSYYTLGGFMHNFGDYPDAIENLFKALEYAVTPWIKAESMRLISLSHIYLDESDKALEYLEECIEIFDSIGDKYGLARSYIDYGLLYENKANFLEALSYYQRALEISEELNDLSFKAFIFNNMGVINHNLSMNLIALDYYKQAYEISNRIGLDFLEATILSNMSEVYIDEGDFNTALAKIEMGINITEGTGNKKDLTYLLLNKGQTYLHLGQYKQALKNFNLAHKISNEIGTVNADVGLRIQVGFGKTYYKLKDYPKAIEYLTDALRIGIETNTLHIIRDASNILAEVYATYPDHKKAYEYMKLSKEMTDSLNVSKVIKQFTQMEMQFEFDKKQHELQLLQQKAEFENKRKMEKQKLLSKSFIAGFFLISLLVVVIYNNYRNKHKLNIQLAQNLEKIKEQNLEIEIKNKNLQDLNNTKDKFFSIIAHDLKTPFNTILGFSELIAGKENLTNEELKRYGSIIFTSAGSSYRLLENLLKWSQINTNTLEVNYEVIEFEEILENVLGLFNASIHNKDLKIRANIESGLKIKADKNMIMLVIRNLISNAIKFCKKGDSIELIASTEGNNFRFTIIDTGVGVKKEDIPKLFISNSYYSTKGTANEPGTGLGLHLCRDFIQKHKGDIWCESEYGKGCKFSFIIPT